MTAGTCSTRSSTAATCGGPRSGQSGAPTWRAVRWVPTYPSGPRRRPTGPSDIGVSLSPHAAMDRRMPPASSPPGELFSRYWLDDVYDEMFDAAGQARPQCRALVEDLLAASL